MQCASLAWQQTWDLSLTGCKETTGRFYTIREIEIKIVMESCRGTSRC